MEQEIILQVNGYTFRGTTLPFPFCLPSELESTLEGKNLLRDEQILSLKSRAQFGRSMLFREPNRKHNNYSLLKKMVEQKQHGDLPIHLKGIVCTIM